MDRAAGIPAHIESLARKLETWMATDLVDSERDALRRILIAAASGTDEVQGFSVGTIGHLVAAAAERTSDEHLTPHEDAVDEVAR